MTTSMISAEDWFYEGTRLMAEGGTEAAERAFRDALRLQPQLAEAHANLGLLLDQAGRKREAEESYRQALTLAPDQVQTHINLGAMLEELKRFAEAEATYRTALSLAPDAPAAWTNLGVLLTCTHRETEAEQCFRTAMDLAPDYRNASFSLACLLLSQGRYEEGWTLFESRDWYERLGIDLPRWRGETLTGKTFLIGIEAGHGDMIQFCRYATNLKELGAARVSVLCHPALKTLLLSLPAIDDTIAFGEASPDMAWDYWSPALSLPCHCRTRLETIPAALPYLHAAPDRIAHWASLIGDSGQNLKVGLAWKGNPRFENDAERSLDSLHQLAPLGRIPGIRYFSLQKGAGEAEASDPSPPLPIIDLGAQAADFSDTAAIVMNLDLVIAVDTAVAHLAGALGKPCWVMLPDYKTDWRWLKQRNDSPWYPGVVRLFRQDPFGTWGPVIDRIGAALEALQQERSKAQ